jgi:RNA polymerase-binding transcription factor
MTMTESARSADLKEMLIVRRSEMRDEVQSRIRQGRTGQRIDARDDIDLSDADIQGDIEFALIQMRTDTLSRIDVALSRLAAGDYGACVDCKGEITPQRLRALPFAVRCQGCEERREQTQGRPRQLAQRRGSFTLFPDVVGS